MTGFPSQGFLTKSHGFFQPEEYAMNCPSCDRELKSIQAGSIEAYVCHEGCGGVWFDGAELSKTDEPLERAGLELMGLARIDQAPAARGLRRNCPRCAGLPMRRHYFRVKRTVEVDECPECGGFWLDSHDLGLIREIHPGDVPIQWAPQIDEASAADSGPGRRSAEDRRWVADPLERLFRRICPSYSFSGKQDQGVR
jgi:hypothetical protein